MQLENNTSSIHRINELEEYLRLVAQTTFGCPVSIKHDNTNSNNGNTHLIDFVTNKKDTDSLFLIKEQQQQQQEEEDTCDVYVYGNANTLKRRLPSTGHVLVITRPTPFVEDATLAEQLNIINLPLHHNNKNTLNQETFQNTIKQGLIPYLDIIAENDGDAKGEGEGEQEVEAQRETRKESGIVRKKFEEFISILHRSDTEILVPNLLHTTHYKVQDVIDQKTTLESVMEDTIFLNELTSITNVWVKQIQTITHSNHTPLDGNSLADEVLFWTQMEQALLSLTKQIQSPQVKTTLEILSRARRYHVTISFENNTGINEMITKTNIINSFLRELPIQELQNLSRDSLMERFQKILGKTFLHVKLKLYLLPLDRARDTVYMLLKESIYKMRELMVKTPYMSMSMPELESSIKSSYTVLNFIEGNIKALSNLLRELARKTKDKSSFSALDQNDLDQLREKLDDIMNVKRNHNELLENIAILKLKKFGETNIDASSADLLINAYNKYLLSAIPIHPTKEVENLWVVNKRAYNQVYKLVYETWLSQLSFYFSRAKSFKDYLKILCKFIRKDPVPKLTLQLSDENKLAILDAAYGELRLLQTKCQKCHSRKHVSLKEKLALQSIKAKVEFYKVNLQLVLGDAWSQYTIGQRVKTVCENIEALLVSDLAMLKNFSANKIEELEDKNGEEEEEEGNATNKITRLAFNSSGNIEKTYFSLLSSNIRKLKESQTLSSWSQVGIILPFTKSLGSTNAESRSLSIFAEVLDQLHIVKMIYAKINKDNYGNVFFSQAKQYLEYLTRFLVVFFKADLNDFDKLAKIFPLATKDEFSIPISSRETDIYANFLKTLDNAKLLLTEITALSNFFAFFDQNLHNLRKSKYDYEEISTCIKNIQNTIGDTVFGSDESANTIYQICNKYLGENLSFLFQQQLLMFEQYFFNQTKVPIKASQSQLFFQPVYHTLYIEEGKLALNPTINKGKNQCFANVEILMQVILKQKMLHQNSARPQNFDSRIFLENKPLLNKVYANIEQLYQEGETYINDWCTLERLCAIDVGDENEKALIFQQDKDITSWFETLKEIYQRETIFDEAELEKHFKGLFTISFKALTNRFATSYLYFEKGTVKWFVDRLEVELRTLCTKLIDAKQILQKPIRFESGAKSVILSIEKFLNCTSELELWMDNVLCFKNIQIFLVKHNFKFPSSGWTYVEQLQSQILEVKALCEKKKLFFVDKGILLKDLVKMEFQTLWDSAKDLEIKWANEKPSSESSTPQDAIRNIKAFLKKTNELQNYLGILCKINLNFEMELDTKVPDFQSILSEIERFDSIWSSLSILWEELLAIKMWPWKNVEFRTLGNKLVALLKSAGEWSLAIRQYSAAKKLQSEIDYFLKAQPKLSELSSSVMRERHWRKLLSQMGLKFVYDNLTVGDLWQLSLRLNSQFIDDVLEQARQESIIEESLKEMIESWRDCSFELFNYENKYRLIKNWGPLLEKLEVNSSTINAMKKSEHAFVFAKEIEQLEGKIASLYELFNIWVDVQQEWVDLEGVFGNKRGDIRILLPTESARFETLTSDLFLLLKRLYKVDELFDIISVPDVCKTMRRFSQVLNRLQTSLVEYLNQQRELFPRLYFIGDDDLLEMIGASNNPTKLGKHMKKLFMGVERLLFEPVLNTITGVVGEGEEVLKFAKGISFSEYPLLHEWISVLEREMQLTLARLVSENVMLWKNYFETLDEANMAKMIQVLPGQVLLLLTQVVITATIEDSNAPAFGNVAQVLKYLEKFLLLLIQTLKRHSDALMQRKVKNLIIEILHQKNVLSAILSADSVLSRKTTWILHQRYYFTRTTSDPTNCLIVKQAYSEFKYGFEYIGNPEKLAYTPLINECFITMSQALSMHQGGAPFGPAGTGKTESIKALGQNLGKMVVVFCCDESYDYASISRILIGISQVGAWACFDEFNRLEEHTLSAVSSLVGLIENGLNGDVNRLQILDKTFKLNPETGLFVTMNPGYANRSTLPENLKKQFRSFSMQSPDSLVIAEVLLASQTFEFAKDLAGTVVAAFTELEKQATKQVHYDFGLRAIKATIRRCGEMLRMKMRAKEETKTDFGGEVRTSEDKYGNQEEIEIENEKEKTKTKTKYKEEQRNGYIACSKSEELKIILSSLEDSILPKLVRLDRSVYFKIINDLFSGIELQSKIEDKLTTKLTKACTLRGFIPNNEFVEKAIHLCKTLEYHKGVMMVGESGSGKSAIFEVVVHVLSSMNGLEPQVVTVNPKVMSKTQLYGNYDKLTKLWSDGLLTNLLRKVNDNLRGESQKQFWIVFDGDVDPIWAENLNSLLDDNQTLTIPNGERLHLPSNVKIIFETRSLRNATPATISRCGIVWFDKDIVGVNDLTLRLVTKLRHEQFKKFTSTQRTSGNSNEDLQTVHLEQILDPTLLKEFDLVAQEIEHVMTYTFQRSINTVFALLKSFLNKISILPAHEISSIDINEFIKCAIFVALMWSFAGDSNLDGKWRFETCLKKSHVFSTLKLPPDLTFNYELTHAEQRWISLGDKLGPPLNLQPDDINDPNLVIPTEDTVKHESLLHSLLVTHTPLLLCGPPGSGKTMTLLKAIAKAPHLTILSLNFSKETTAQSLIASLENACIYKTINGQKHLLPKLENKWLVVFCDEINLPRRDHFGTQKVTSLLTLMIEKRGFWHPKDYLWVSLDKIQFVGACNPPTDAGRYDLDEQFLRHVCLIMVDHPTKGPMTRIYETMHNAILKLCPSLKVHSSQLTFASIEIYESSKAHFANNVGPEHVYSPRELTRWCRGILHALKRGRYLQLPDLIRLWYHEGLRLFFDRLAKEEQRKWIIKLFREVSHRHFPVIDFDKCYKEPVLFSDWLSREYQSVEEAELTKFVLERLRIYNEEEADIQLVLHSTLLDHILRIDRVLKQPQGHLILVGPHASGKRAISKFAAWINGLTVEQLSVRRGFTLDNFDDFLRKILLRCLEGEKLCVLIDEASVVEASFIERMNTLLANAEIPGLFEGEDKTILMNRCFEKTLALGLSLETDAELYKWFSSQLSQNLHIVFLVPDSTDSTNLIIISSPALLNRCVLNWMGDWTIDAYYSVGNALLEGVSSLYDYSDISSTRINGSKENPNKSLKSLVLNVLIDIHRGFSTITSAITSSFSISKQVYPGQFVKFVETFAQLCIQKLSELDDRNRHLILGYQKIKETVSQVAKLKKDLVEKEKQLLQKNSEARKMLDKMLVDQNEAERKQELSVDIQAELEKQELEINSRKAIAEKELKLAEPAILHAQRGVQDIKKQHLTEIRSMANPPHAVKLTMEAVCILLGYNVSTWRDVQLAVRSEDFIPNIVNFDCEEVVTNELQEYMEVHYLARDDFTFEAVHRASKACGPLLNWVRAQLAYSKVLSDVEPLREEAAILEQRSIKSKAQLIAIRQMIEELETKIEEYKGSYSDIIREVEMIKIESASVEEKITRSTLLIDSLHLELTRWKDSIDLFAKESDEIHGNAVLAAAFVSYAGPLDEKGRNKVLKVWKEKLSHAGIKCDENLIISEYLVGVSTLENHLQHGLTDDELNKANFALLEKAVLPIIIDPSGTAADVFISSLESLIKRTKFMSNSFFNDLENALRFGLTLLIEDCEYYDPIIDQVIRKETKRRGGRVLVRVGDDWIDLHSKFRLLLMTKRTQVNLPNFIFARAGLVNYSITSGNLENRAIDLALKKRSPELAVQRTELLFAKGKYQVQLLKLEDSLLELLSLTSAGILENDKVLGHLERLKKESLSLSEKLGKADEIMFEILHVRSRFETIAEVSVTIFQCLTQLKNISSFYEITSHDFFLAFEETMSTTFSIEQEKEVETYFERAFCSQLYNNFSPSLAFKDKFVCSLLMTIVVKCRQYGVSFEQLLAYLSLQASNDTLVSMDPQIIDLEANPELEKDVLRLFEGHIANLQLSKLDIFLPISKWTSELRPFGESYESEWTLEKWVHDKSCHLFIMTTSNDFDATYKILDLAESEQEVDCTVISMGSSESSILATTKLKEISSTGKWLIIQNVHMFPSWLLELENFLNHTNMPQSSKIFLTCDQQSNIPDTLIRLGKVYYFENDGDFRRSFMDTFKMVPSSVLETSQMHRHVFLLLTWFHRMIMEILEYCPFVFKKRYDINESDFQASVNIFTVFLGHFGELDDNIWELIRFSIINNIYGAKVEDVEDKSQIAKLVQRLFIAESLDSDFQLVSSVNDSKDDDNVNDTTNNHDYASQTITMWTATSSTEDCFEWIRNLPESIPLSWLELQEDLKNVKRDAIAKEALNSICNFENI